MVRKKIKGVDVGPKLLSNQPLKEFRKDWENRNWAVRGDFVRTDTVALKNRLNTVAFPRRGENTIEEETIEEFLKEGRESSRACLKETRR